jgi:cyclin B
LKNHLTNKAKDVKENPFIKNKENIYSFKNNKNVNRSIEKRRNFKTQMSFRIERPNQRKINEANKNNFIGNKENIDNNLSIINYKSKGKNIIKKNNKTIDKKVSKLMIKSFQNIKVKEKIKVNKENEIKKDKEKINYFDITKIENNVQIPKEYINTIYYNLLNEENIGIYPQAKYNYMDDQSEINERMRGILIDWLIEVHFKFGFTDETLYMTVSIIDRYLSSNSITKKNLQLLGITSLFISCKHEEIDVPKINDFTYITNNAYDKNEVIQMEDDILKFLKFNLLYPSPIKFFEYLSLHFNFNKKMHMMGKYLMESFLLDIKNIKYKSSIIACACCYIVMKFFKISNYKDSYDKKFYSLEINEKSKFNENDIKDCAKDICLLIDSIHKNKFFGCQKKFSDENHEKVSLLIMNNN